MFKCHIDKKPNATEGFFDQKTFAVPSHKCVFKAESMDKRAIVTPIFLLALILSTLPLQKTAHSAATITVNTTSDQLTNDALCSLREAIIAANSDSAVGGCNAGSGIDIILFDANLSLPATFTLSITGTGEDATQRGDLDITSSLTITPANASQIGKITIDGNASDRVFHILNSAKVSINGLIVQNGNPGSGNEGGGFLLASQTQLTMNNATIRNNSSLTGGVKTQGRFTLTNGTVENNQGGGITNDASIVTLNNVSLLNNSGGFAIRNQGNGGLIFDRGTIRGNPGGIYNTTATATLSNLEISQNSNSAIYNTGVVLSQITLKNSSLLSNTAFSGAGIYNDGLGTKVTVIDSRISGNQVTGAGGGIFNNGTINISKSTLAHNQALSGAGIRHFGGDLSITNVTFSQNSAGNNGGALYIGSSAIVASATFYANTAGGTDSGDSIYLDEASITLRNSIIATVATGSNCFNSSGFLTSLGHNLESGNSCELTATGDLPNSDPKLGALQNNGGASETHALLTNSPAINAGDTANCPTTDQRGAARPQGGSCDIGAYESGSLPASSPTPTRTKTPTPVPATQTPTATRTTTATPTARSETATPSPTATPISATDTPTTIPVTNTPLPLDTATPLTTATSVTPTATHTPGSPTATATIVATATGTITPSSTVVSTITPSPTDVGSTPNGSFKQFLPIITR